MWTSLPPVGGPNSPSVTACLPVPDKTATPSCPACGAYVAPGTECASCAASIASTVGRTADEPATVASNPVSSRALDGLLAGARVGGRYTVIKLLGRGGMGAVYQAWDAELGIPVAIKTILQSGGDDPHASLLREHRFKRELLLARQVSHKNVVRIHDIGEVDGAKYITMAFVDGETLAARLRRGPLPVSEALGLARQIASGLVAAHEASVIHRDLKPENVMVTPDGVAVIMDFGIARPVEPTAATFWPRTTRSPSLTSSIEQCA